MASAPKIALALLVLAALAAPVLADGHAFTASGSFLLGDGLSAELMDSCVSNGYAGRDGPQEGLDSNCVALPEGLAGLPYAITSSDMTHTAQVEACFYDAANVYLGCPSDGVVPEGAAQASLFTLTGYAVSWTLTIG